MTLPARWRRRQAAACRRPLRCTAAPALASEPFDAYCFAVLEAAAVCFARLLAPGTCAGGAAAAGRHAEAGHPGAAARWRARSPTHYSFARLQHMSQPHPPPPGHVVPPGPPPPPPPPLPEHLAINKMGDWSKLAGEVSVSAACGCMLRWRSSSAATTSPCVRGSAWGSSASASSGTASPRA
jgi:hypothetical protein